MEQKTAVWQEVSDTELRLCDYPTSIEEKIKRYDLATAIRVVRGVESTAARGAVFAEIKDKNPLYRLVDNLYSKAGARVGQPFLLYLYMLTCVLSLGPFDDDNAEAIGIANFSNEHNTIDRLAAILAGTRILRLSLKWRHMFSLGQLRAAVRVAGTAPRVWSFLARLARSHSFMPAARVASCLAYYARFSQVFADRPGLNAGIVASNYSPEAVGLAAAAHGMCRRVIYVNHAPVPANAPSVPPVLADCAVFYGDAMRQTYERRSHCTADVALIGQPGAIRPMTWSDDVRTVGIFLTALTRTDAVAALVAAIRATCPGVRVLIRNHPVALVKSDFSELAARYGNLDITQGNRLDDEIAACDLIFCGNSGVALNALRGGRPVAYCAELDGLRFDYNGFVESGLVCDVPVWSEDLYARLKGFYTSSAWQPVMQSYDASYGADAAELERAAARTIRRYLSPTPGRG